MTTPFPSLDRVYDDVDRVEHTLSASFDVQNDEEGTEDMDDAVAGSDGYKSSNEAMGDDDDDNDDDAESSHDINDDITSPDDNSISSPMTDILHDTVSSLLATTRSRQHHQQQQQQQQRPLLADGDVVGSSSNGHHSHHPHHQQHYQQQAGTCVPAVMTASRALPPFPSTPACTPSRSNTDNTYNTDLDDSPTHPHHNNNSNVFYTSSPTRGMSPLPYDMTSPSSIGGHHLALTIGPTFLKQSDSRREERFYGKVWAFQTALVEEAVTQWLKEQETAAAAARQQGTGVAGDTTLTRMSSGEDDLAAAGGCQRRSCRLGSLQSELRAAKARSVCPRHAHYHADVCEDCENMVSNAREAGGGYVNNNVAQADISSVCSNHNNTNSNNNSSDHNNGSDEEQARRENRLHSSALHVASALWWTVKLSGYQRLDYPGTYEVQRRAHHMSANPLGAPHPTHQQQQQQLQSSDEGIPYELERTRALQLIAPFVPLFHGIRTFTMPQQQQRRSAPSVTLQASEIADDPSDSGNQPALCRMVVLEDVCFGFGRPCVLDVKMGSRQYGLHPSAAKRLSKERKAKLSTSGQYGVRLAGYRRWADEAQDYVSKSKLECRGLTLDEVRSELRAFLRGSHSLRSAVAMQLQELRTAFAQQSVFRFFTSSLLIVYDADRPVETCRVVMVDFAYTYERRELESGGDPEADYDYDVGYIKALDTLLSVLA